MSTTNKTQVSKNLDEKSILVARTFDAPLDSVWRAYTERELLDRWWGPEPWRAETKHMDFSEGGHWLYAMVGPDGTRIWGIMQYKRIIPLKSMEGEDGFCDEHGVINPAFPIARWITTFTETSSGVLVEQKGFYQKLEDLQVIVDMGFEQGISMGLDQLEALLAKQIF
jgi:uncharacterized protein YndB with AHSA1/START domain